MPKKLPRGKVAIVTGAAGGIGRCVAERLSEVVTGLVLTDWVPFESTPSCAAHCRMITVQADLTEEKGASDVVASALQTFGRVDLVVNNAGGNFAPGGKSAAAPIEDTTVEEWEFILNNNLRTTFLLSRAAVPHMKARRSGCIINIGSMAGKVGYAMGTVPYSAAKAGVSGLTRALAKQLGEFGITVNCIAPGYIVSGSRLQKAWDERNKSGAAKPIVESIALKRLGTPQEVADVVVFLASKGASYITGSTIDVFGGACII